MCVSLLRPQAAHGCGTTWHVGSQPGSGRWLKSTVLNYSLSSSVKKTMVSSFCWLYLCDVSCWPRSTPMVLNLKNHQAATFKLIVDAAGVHYCARVVVWCFCQVCCWWLVVLKWDLLLLTARKLWEMQGSDDCLLSRRMPVKINLLRSISIPVILTMFISDLQRRILQLWNSLE